VASFSGITFSKLERSSGLFAVNFNGVSLSRASDKLIRLLIVKRASSFDTMFVVTLFADADGSGWENLPMREDLLADRFTFPC
jgi:hypothetical protein